MKTRESATSVMPEPSANYEGRKLRDDQSINGRRIPQSED
jgi:hypothetical protein